MSTYALAALPDERALTAQADRLRHAHANLMSSLARPATSMPETQTQEFRSLELELTAVESRVGVASALARAAERTARDAARLLGLRPLWMERYALDEETEADQENTASSSAGRRGRAA